jgi:DNA-binding response OmpR family regulator
MMRILIADDDPDCLALVADALRGPGIEFVSATDGDKLLALVATSGPFDLIITDISMPWMEGHQVLASARAAGLVTPVLVVTGRNDQHLAHTISQLGHAKLLQKPFAIADLRAAVSELLL